MMKSRSKRHLLLTLVCITAATLISCSDSSEKTDMDKAMEQSHAAMKANSSEAEKGEEVSNDAISNNANYLEQLAYIRGHLNVGVELYREGDAQAAKTHMKHPESEIYANLLPALKARKAPEFGEQLAVLAQAVEQEQAMETVEAAYQQVLAGISQAEAVVKEQKAALLGKVIFALIQTTAAEYDIAVSDNLSLENAHEYQDSLGFLRVAKALMPRLQEQSDNNKAVEAIQKELDLISPAWTGVQAPARLTVEPAVIYGAASRIQIAILEL